jgi:hypothetical protein
VGRVRDMNECKRLLAANLFHHVDRAILELENSVSKEAAAEIAEDLDSLKKARAKWPVPRCVVLLYSFSNYTDVFQHGLRTRQRGIGQ